MLPTWADFEQSLRRSPARERVLLTIVSLSISYATPLAKAASVDYAQLMGILYGAPPKYSRTRALVPLGLVRAVDGPNGRAYEATDRARRKARQLTSRKVRAIQRRLARGTAEPKPPAPAGPREPA
ncbi:MAG TPA: archaellum operon transcriptional activator EarA family protein, partial [Candidatus Thermoplasmatota archaeon]|nr:archaellum operon transcriptional activator EarA family protein [Candidatus Thermoplasmatota archaeon]